MYNDASTSSGGMLASSTHVAFTIQNFTLSHARHGDKDHDRRPRTTTLVTCRQTGKAIAGAAAHSSDSVKALGTSPQALSPPTLQQTSRHNMIPTTELSPLGQHFEGQCTKAWEYFEAELFDEANAISRTLVKDPRVGLLHKASCHMILAHSPDDYVYHAEQAVKLFRDMYNDPRDPPDEDQRRSQEKLVASAEKVLVQARDDAQTYASRADSPQQDSKASQIPQRLSTGGLRSILEGRITRA
ncbi:hypothetical protein DOTSEDRAFT_73612 [Dothistroma septosporum NZE10]|uniref:Uncharacterized protein n=1 Tax=Dothistroma septosporum (strain NZE10 / CBS 128990) TaxID=675120 RepID=N1PF70_DOTSN|nr:hypothetical protein DOTSEDRAFT_73612 [Dothistroma septosporum NZE10]